MTEKLTNGAVVLVTGGRGLVGRALQNRLAEANVKVVAPTSSELDLRDPNATHAFFREVSPDYVFHLAARVYGIMGNIMNKGVSIYENVMINTNVIEGSRLAGVKKVVSMGSGCVYPYPPPAEHLTEDMIFRGEPHSSEDSYAHSKRLMYAMQKAYQEQYGLDYAFVVSGNLFGPHDSFDFESGHVIPSLVHKFYNAAREMTPIVAWGTGKAQRDFTYSSDVAEALTFIMEGGQGAINMGSGQVHKIHDIIECLAEVSGIGMDAVQFDTSKPDGQEYRYYDVSKLQALGFKPRVTLAEGLQKTYDWFVKNYDQARL
ncbi:GDP-L-fucose synthase family protein [Asticcacaulis machinosus]|uniref:GDP-L-fucose synthase n=1 Tax=Asticcacaulis machinosus TaxID=2984211 RepID=A0ABT5HK45_9CAUL|nr:GDP-L-fucose synthase [Asticcacaulis machinosus]MDC7676495.1 GDP-L-fucose synthase [Asticcacaulis machinosus]